MKKILYFLIPLVLLVLVFSQIGSSGDDDYSATIQDFRTDKEDFYRTSQASPFVERDSGFPGLTYYPADKQFKVTARLERLQKRETLEIQNSDGTSTKYLKFANARFKLKGEEYSLLILKALGFGNQYLTAFADETSGDATYGGGRYLDLDIGKSDRVEIDFNKAYNPYCAYFEDYLCPFPPRENILEIAIEAGEKDFKGQ